MSGEEPRRTSADAVRVAVAITLATQLSAAPFDVGSDGGSFQISTATLFDALPSGAPWSVASLDAAAVPTVQVRYIT